MTAGDSGIVFKFYPTVASSSNPDLQIPFPIDPTATVKMLVQAASTPALPHEEYPMTVSSDGLSASYILAGTEFPVGNCLYRITMRISAPGLRLTADDTAILKVDEDFIN